MTEADRQAQTAASTVMVSEKHTLAGDRFGIDLGTTNSALCYYNTERKAFDYLKIGSQTRDFFPTMIAYDKKDPAKRLIGEAARRYQFSKNYDVYSLFKLSMGEQAFDKKGRLRSPYEVTRDFLAEVIRTYQEMTGQAQLNNLVLTVPDIWKNEEKNKIAVDHLQQIFHELGWEEERIALESEPVSAVAYYSQEICKGYDGYVLVIDYGGGTLDLTLCQVKEGNQITVLRRCGDGGSAMGCAGVAFDTALTQRMIEKYQLDPQEYAPGTRMFGKLYQAIEQMKIDALSQTTKALNQYYRDFDPVLQLSYSDTVAFDVPAVSDDEEQEDFQIMASDLAETFSKVNQPALDQALETMKEYCRELSVDTGSQDAFRVLMVGGFSNLYCVESRCRAAFQSLDDIKGDQRFDAKMRQDNRCSTAIAHGAGIIAAGMAQIRYLCPSDIGFYYYDVCSQKQQAAVVIHRNTPVTDYKIPHYFPGKLRPASLARNTSVCLFFDDGEGQVPITMEETFRQLCPNAEQQDNVYQIGFSMGAHQIPMIHVRDKNGEEASQSLHQIISRIALQLVTDKETLQ